MTTYSFTRTRGQISRMVLSKLGVVGAGQTPNSDDEELVYEAMDLRLKELHARGALWFSVSGEQASVALTSGVASVVAASDVLFPITMSIRVGTSDEPVEIIGHRQFQEIPNKADTGTPAKVLFSGGTLRFWPTPDVNYTAKMTYERVAADTEAEAVPDIEVSMVRSFRDILVYDLADDFGAPDSKIVRWKMESVEALRTILALNAEKVDNTPTTAEYF